MASDRWHSFARPFAPLMAAARGYDRAGARQDLVAAATVTVVALPQAMAFALIAGVDPIYGLYGLMVQTVLGALFTSASRLSVGPTNTISLLTASVAARIVDGSGDTYLAVVTGLTLITGLIQLVFALARMGNLVRFVSHAVILGFTAGAGVLIAAKQLPNFLGVPVDNGSHLPGLPGVLHDLGPRIAATDPRAVFVGAVSLGVLLVTRGASRLLPGPLMSVLAGALLVVSLGWTGAAGGVHTVGALPDAVLPPPSLPTLEWGQIERMISGGLALALIGMIEAVAIAKSLSNQTGESINPNREFFTQGVTNTVSSFLSCYPGTASFSRSALNVMAGARTRFASVYCSVLVVAALLLFSEWARHIPLPSLAAILFVVAYGLVDWRYFARLLRADRADAMVSAATFGATLTIPLEYAVFVGIFFNLALFVRRASRLQIHEMVRAPEGRFVERPLQLTDRADRDLLFLQLEGDLFFGVADELQEQLSEIERSEVRVVVIRLKRCHSMDATVLHVLEDFVERMNEAGRGVILCGLRPQLAERVRAYGLTEKIGEANVMETRPGVFVSAQEALDRASELLGRPASIEGVESDEPSWEI